MMKLYFLGRFMREEMNPDLFVVGWVIQEGEQVEGYPINSLCFSGDGGDNFLAMSLDRATELQKMMDGSKVYKLVEVESHD